MSFSDVDRQHLARAIELARRGLYTTRPNPRVGCVLTTLDGAVLAEAWTAPAGGLHAEAQALRAAGAEARGCTAYTTLEPCAHHGRTPPCADALIASGVARVVVGAGDPFDAVDGAGLARLRAAGITVETGLMEAECRALNPGFHRRHEGGAPWVRLKLAASVDGRTAMASGESRWITGPEARADVQRLRARSCAVITGVGTVLADDPRLTLRRGELGDLPDFDLDFLDAHPPLRVVLDARARTPAEARILLGGEALVLHGPDADAGALNALAGHAGTQSVPAAAGGVDLRAVLAVLAERACNEVLLECGPTLAAAALDQGLVDELWLYQAPLLLGASARPLAALERELLADAPRFAVADLARVGDDVRLVLVPREAPSGGP